jgi:hypothetical protein
MPRIGEMAEGGLGGWMIIISIIIYWRTVNNREETWRVNKEMI